LGEVYVHKGGFLWKNGATWVRNKHGKKTTTRLNLINPENKKKGKSTKKTQY